MKSHLLLMVLFAFFVSLVFAVISKDDAREQARFGGDDVRRVHAGGRGARLVDVSVPAVTSDTLLVERGGSAGPGGAVAVVTFNRPAVRNALNAETLDELRRVMLELRDDESVRVVILTGAGDKAFVAGADIHELAVQTATSARAFALAGQHVFDVVENLGKPVIAAINGYALGGGCELAMACTLRLAADTAKLGQPEINLGIIPGYAGSQRLARLVGKGKAMELLLTGAPISAAEAERIGLVNRVVAASELMNEARTLAEQLAGNAPMAMRYILDVSQPGPRDAVCRSGAPTKRRCSAWWRPPTTCARARRRSSKNASRTSRGADGRRDRQSGRSRARRRPPASASPSSCPSTTTS